MLDRTTDLHAPATVTNRTAFCKALGLEYSDMVYQNIVYGEGQSYIKIALTPTTAKGHRKLNTEEDFRHWIEGIIHYHEITQLPHHKRTAAIGQIVIKSGRHVAMGTDAG
jgi:hypothetical protein